MGSDGASLERSVDAFVDPISYRGEMHLYEYVGDSPLIATDPTGLTKYEPPGCLFAAFSGLPLVGIGSFAVQTSIETDAARLRVEPGHARETVNLGGGQDVVG